MRRRRPAGKDQMTRLIFESMIAKKPDIGMLRFYRHDFWLLEYFYRLIILEKVFFVHLFIEKFDRLF
jgi:hypothetical protein